MDTVHVGVIGCGGIAFGKHLPSMQRLEGVQVDAFCDVIPERAARARQEYGHPDSVVVTEYAELLKLPLDAVYVLTPNRWHAEMTVAALSAGKHVMCEKPMAISSSEAEGMVQAATQAQKVLTIGYQNRWRPDAQYLRKICRAEDLGHIYFAKALAVRRRGIPTQGVFLSKADQGGGPLIDIGTHALDLTLWCMNNYEPAMVVGTTFTELAHRGTEVNSWGPWNASAMSVEDAAFGYIQMRDGALIWLEASWALNTLETGEAQTLLCGTRGGADMRDGLRLNGVERGALVTKRLELRGRGETYAEVPLESRPEYTEAREFIRAVRGEPAVTVDARQALVVTRILEALYESAQTHQPVWLRGAGA